MPLRVQRYNVINGAMTEDAAGAFCTFADASAAYSVLESAGALARDSLAIAERDLGVARSRVGVLEQGVRRAQADLGFVHPTESDERMAAIVQELDVVRSKLTR